MHWDAFQERSQERFENEAISNSEMAYSNSSVYDVNQQQNGQETYYLDLKRKKIKEKRALCTLYFNLWGANTLMANLRDID